MVMLGGVLGLLIGAALGLTGAGGGIFAVPALVFGLGLELREAAPIALLAVGSTAALGAVQGLFQGIVRYRAGLVLAVAGAAAAPAGVHVARQVPAAWLNVLFAAAMFAVAHRMFAASRSSGAAQDARDSPCPVSSETGRFIWSPRTAAILAGIGVVAGLFTGLLGVGGGFLIVPALAYFTPLRMNSIVATSLMAIAILSATAVLAAWGQGLALNAAAWAFLVSAAIGMFSGRLLARRMSSAILQRAFSVLCAVVGIMMLLRGLG